MMSTVSIRRILPRLLPTITLVALAAGCSSDSVVSPSISPEKSKTLAAFTCTATISSRSVSCVDAGDPLKPNYSMQRNAIIIGGQHVNVDINAYNITNDTIANHFAFDLNVRNRMGQTIGTIDGATPDSIRVFFSSGPTTTLGTGSVSVFNPSGIGAFTGPNQPFFQYFGAVGPGSYTSDKNWILAYDEGVQTFAFELLVSANVQYPNGYIDVFASSTTVPVGGTLQIQDSVRNVYGRATADQSETWSVSDTTKARIDSTGLLSGISSGLVTVTATNTSGVTGSVTIAVSALAPIQFQSVEAHTRFSCGLSVAGAAFCWGSDYFGTLGTGSPSLTTSKCAGLNCNLRPFPVHGGHVFSQLSDGLVEQCALATDGAYCWGMGSAGNIGNGANDVTNPVPTKVQTSETYTSISGGRLFTCGLTTLHKIDCWGSNLNGELGNPATTETCQPSILLADETACSRTPLRIAGSLDFYKVNLGWSHACALTEDGTAYCWGVAEFGGTGAVPTAQCGDLQCNPTPTAVVTDLKFTDIGAGSYFTCGISTAGNAYCWGKNTYDQAIGGNTSEGARTPVQLSSTVQFVKIVAGDDQACALDAQGTAYCWGYNGDGQLGIGTQSSNEVTPIAISNLKFTSLSIGSFHSCGMATDGYAYCWGKNTNGQLGTDSNAQVLVPTKVAGQ